MTWLQQLPSASANSIPWGSVYLPTATIRMLEKLGQANSLRPPKVMPLDNVSPTKVYLIGSVEVPDASVIFEIGDRVMCVRGSVSIPVGTYGMSRIVVGGVLMGWVKGPARSMVAAIGSSLVMYGQPT